MSAKNKILENISFIDIHSAGKVIGKFKNRNIFVDNAIPGEIADIEIPRRVKQGKFTFGKILKLNKISDERTAPFCIHYGICGGCNWQHMNYNAQLNYKKQILTKALEKYGIKTPLIPDVIGSPKQKLYRNKSEYAYADTDTSTLLINKELCDLKEPVIGFHLAGSLKDVIDINECFLQDFYNKIDYLKLKNILINWSNLNPKLLKSFTIRTSLKGELMLTLNFNELNERIDDICNHIIEQFPNIGSFYKSISIDDGKRFQFIHISGKEYISENLGEIMFDYGPDSFYQPNPLQAINIYNKIVEFAHTSGNEFVYDLYTGIGTIASVLAKHVSKVVGIEGSANAIENAKKNALINKIRNVDFITGDILETFKPSLVEQCGKPDIIVLDPPRSGTLTEIKKTILWAEPLKIIYLSCNPVSLAWDLKQLTEKYEVTKIQPYDMFPHTHHLETLVMLELRK